MIKEVLRQQREKITYLVAGVFTSLTSWGSYAAFIYIGCGINISNIASWIVTVLFSYIVNKTFVFQKPGWGITQILKEVTTYISSRLITGAIEIASVPILLYMGVTQSFFQIEGFWAKFLAGLLPLILNYIIGKKAVFKNQSTK